MIPFVRKDDGHGGAWGRVGAQPPDGSWLGGPWEALAEREKTTGPWLLDARRDGPP